MEISVKTFNNEFFFYYKRYIQVFFLPRKSLQEKPKTIKVNGVLPFTSLALAVTTQRNER